MRYTLTVLLLVLITAYGCKKDDKTTKPDTQSYKLTYVSTMRDHLEIDYANGKVSEVRFTIPSMTGGQPYVQWKHNYSYTGDKIQKVQYSSGSWRTVYYSADGVPSEIRHGDTTIAYKFGGGEFLDRVYSFSPDRMQMATYDFTYIPSGGKSTDKPNVQTITIGPYPNNPYQTLQHMITYEFTGYDDKKNPRLALPGIEKLAQALIYDYAYTGLDFFVLSENNYTGWVRKRYMTDGTVRTETCTTTYEYNDGGFPTSRTDVIKDGFGTTITDTRSYSYSK